MSAVIAGYLGSNNGTGGTTIAVNLPIPLVPSPLPTGATSTEGITYGNGYWVVPVSSGRILVGTHPSGPWQTVQVFSGSNPNINAIAYGNGYWVAVGDYSGTASRLSWATSPFGPWTAIDSVVVNSNNSIVLYGNGYWLIAGGSTNIQWTTDPTGTWTTNSNGFSGGSYNAGVYDNGTWVLVGSNSSLLYRATDPTGTWTFNPQNSQSGYLRASSVAYGNGYWVIGTNANNGNNIFYSTTLSGTFTGTSQGNGENVLGVAYGGNYWYAVGSAVSTGLGMFVYKSSDPTGTWLSSPRSNTQIGVAYANGFWVTSDSSAGFLYYGEVSPPPSEVFLMAVTVRGGSNTTITDPSGWTLLGSQVNSTTVLGQKLYWRQIDGTEGASVTVTITSNKASAVVVRIRNGIMTAPIAAQYAGQANASSATVTYPDIGTFSSANGIDFVFGGIARGDMTTAAPTGYTETISAASTGGGANSQTQTENAYQLLTGVTGVSGITATWTGTAAVNIGHHVFVADADAPFPYVGGGYYGG